VSVRMQAEVSIHTAHYISGRIQLVGASIDQFHAYCVSEDASTKVIQDLATSDSMHRYHYLQFNIREIIIILLLINYLTISLD
jgi:hypothetical protein